MNNRERRAFTRVSLMYLAFIAIVAVMCALALASSSAGAVVEQDFCLDRDAPAVEAEYKVIFPFAASPPTCVDLRK